MRDFYINLLSGLLGALIVFVIQWAYRKAVEERAPYTGSWRGEIYDDEGEVVKIDSFQMRQRGSSIEGKISRESPASQTHREWRFTGKLRGRQFFAIFWATTLDIQSYGCWYLTQVGDDSFSGYYLSLHQRQQENGALLGVVEPIECSLRRNR